MTAIGLALALPTAASHATDRRPPTLDPTFGRKAAPAPRLSRPIGKGAAWVWTTATRDNQTIAARRAFHLDSLPKTATLYITADNAFTAYLNGHPVGESPSGPDGFAWRQVKTIPVLRSLRTGENTLDIQAHNDSGPGGIAAALVLASGGRSREIVTDGTWKVDDSPPPGWEKAGSGAPTNEAGTGWTAAVVEAPIGGGQWTGLVGWPGLSDVAYLRRMRVLPSAVLEVRPGQGGIRGATSLVRRGPAQLTVTPAPAGSAEKDQPSLTVDFGREITGRVEIDSDSDFAAPVVMSYGESRDEADFGPFGGPQPLELPPHGTAAGRDSAFRYAKIAFPSAGRPLAIRSIRCSHLYYPVEYKGSFASSDSLLDRIWYTGAYTCHLCMQQDIWDAPKRDRARWMGDLQVSGEVINDGFLDRFLMEQTMDRLRADAGDPPHSHVNGIPG